jgi:hypothetical protein
MQQIVNAASTPGEGDRVRGMISALVTAGLEGGYLASVRLAQVHWQAGDRALPAPRASVAGESVLWVDPAEVPADANVAGLGQALAARRHGDRDELMAITAAYSGLRWGELAALTVAQVDPAGRIITVDRKVVEVAGHLYVEAPKNRKYRRTIYPRRTPAGYPLAERLAARLEQARAEQAAGINPLGLIFPSPTGKHWRSSNFNRNVLKRAYLAVGWRDPGGNGRWTWHSLRHVFCTTALFICHAGLGRVSAGNRYLTHRATWRHCNLSLSTTDGGDQGAAGSVPPMLVLLVHDARGADVGVARRPAYHAQRIRLRKSCWICLAQMGLAGAVSRL